MFLHLHVDVVLDGVLAALFTGIAIGFAHVYIGVDHLAALMPISVNRKLRAAWMGVRWGIGHSLGVVIVVFILLAGREAFDLRPVEDWGERLVGLLLIGLGVWGIVQARRKHLHVHSHKHEDGDTHTHLHAHGAKPGVPHSHTHYHKHAALAAGTLHGVAGLAHVMAALPTLAAPTLATSFAYLGGFALGSIFGMAVFAGGFGFVTSRLGERSPSFVKGSMYAAAIACLVIGVAWIMLPLLGIDFLHHDH